MGLQRRILEAFGGSTLDLDLFEAQETLETLELVRSIQAGCRVQGKAVKCGSGAADSLNQLSRLLHPQIKQVVASVVRGRAAMQDVEDLTQAVQFETLKTLIGEYDVERGGPIGAFLAPRVRSRATDLWRKQDSDLRKLEKSVEKELDRFRKSLRPHNPSDPLAAQEAAKLAVQAMLRLPEQERRVIEMVFGFSSSGEMTSRAIADKLGISASTVSALKKQALDKLSKDPKLRRAALGEAEMLLLAFLDKLLIESYL